MSNPLRAFLMLRSQTTGWEIRVVHTLEDLVRAWEERSEPNMTGVLHCGFERQVARSFEGLAQSHPRQMLLTAGGRFALPRAFKSSENPIGFVDEEPVYLALEGWGYQIEAPAKPAFDYTKNLQDWIREYATSHDQDAAALHDTHIFDDASYLENESQLEVALRSRLGSFRTQVKCGGRPSDPCALAKAAPPWLAVRPLEELGLTVRLSNVFARHKIETVSDLSTYTLSEMFEFANFGRKSVNDLMVALERGLAAGVQTDTIRALEISDKPLLELVETTLQRLGERERDILRRRMGWGMPQQTLSDIGDIFGVTRERIRQIEAKTIKKIVREEYWDDLLAGKITSMLADRYFPLPLAGVEALDPWFTGFATNASAVGYILSWMCGGRVSVITIDGLDYLSFMNADGWEHVLRSARQLLESAVERDWSREHCKQMVSGLLPHHSKEFASVLWEKASSLCHFAGSSDDAILISFGRGAEHVVLAILEESERPLHYSEIAVLASERAGREVDDRRAHGAAAEIGYLLGRGTFGTARHLGYATSQLMILAEEATALVSEGPPERQWHTSELAASLSDDADWADQPPNKYVIDVALRLYSPLKRLGRMVWTDANVDTSRVDIRQAVLATLQQAGGPLSSAELHQRLVAIRGVNCGWNFVGTDPVIRLGSGLWGINDRDVPLKRSDQPALQENLVRALETKGMALHVSEILTYRSALTPRMLLSLAALDSRLQVSPGQYLYLRAWGGPRRQTIGEACIDAMRTSGPINFEKLYQIVQQQIGRPCTKNEVSTALQGIEARLDEDGFWSLEEIPPWRDFEAA